MDALKYEYTFDPNEPNNTAASVAAFALSGGSRVLDIGCGPAVVSRFLSKEHGRNVTCVDNDLEALETLSDTEMRVVEADLESPDWLAPIVGHSFDVVILADVLEHLRQPRVLLEALVSNQLLAPGGILVISVPNAGHQAVVTELALGDFRYTKTGILDETHVRWFTLQSLQRLLEVSGFLVDGVRRTTRTLEATPSFERALQVPQDVRRALKELTSESEVYQYVVRATADDRAGRMALDRATLASERRSWATEREEMRGNVEHARAELGRMTALLGEVRESFERELENGSQEIRRLRARLSRVSAERDQLRDELATSLYTESRGVRLAARAVRRARGLRRSV